MMKSQQSPMWDITASVRQESARESHMWLTTAGH